ncbi:MAG TPA: phytoene/squalene synthase family protein, partial [Verrucomicrobiae bacterium]|nr:phytoene/squalene synthase family protein [Verrucomicrobiae bacterium]
MTNLEQLLKSTSRSFYLTLRVLPGPVRPQIGLAYLLARTSDTIADTEIVPLAQRLQSLKKFRDRLFGHNPTPLNFGDLAQHQGNPAEKLLLEKVEDTLAALQQVSAGDQILIRAVLDTIIGGQELDLKRFSPLADREDPNDQSIIALQTEQELDDYTYRVAGCVGEFWTRICRAHLFPDVWVDEEELIADGIRFGKGLQLINILRDLPEDLKKGRCYLPLEKLQPAKLLPEVLLSPANEFRFLPLYRGYLDKAEAHLAAGWRYTNALPFSQFRVRLACAWPILIGARTLDRLRIANVLDLRQNLKISRGEVYRLMLRSLLLSPVPRLWRNLYLPAA